MWVLEIKTQVLYKSSQCSELLAVMSPTLGFLTNRRKAMVVSPILPECIEHALCSGYKNKYTIVLKKLTL